MTLEEAIAIVKPLNEQIAKRTEPVAAVFGGEFDAIIATVENQSSDRETGCLSMRSERLLVERVKRLDEALALIETLNGQPTAQDIARMARAAR